MIAYLKHLIRTLRSHTVWDPGAIPPEEFKYRHLKRLWLPVYDLIAILIGYLGIIYGSRVLNDLFHEEFINTVGAVFVLGSMAALVGVIVPRLFVVEMIGKVIMMSLLGVYSLIIWLSFFFSQEVQSGFVAAMLILPIIMPLFRLQMLGEEVKQRRDEVSTPKEESEI